MLKSFLIMLALCGGMVAVTSASETLDQTIRPTAAGTKKYVVEIYQVTISPKGVKTTSDKPVKTYTFRHYADAASQRDWYNGQPAWTSGATAIIIWPGFDNGA
jgi:hypothetical protein